MTLELTYHKYSTVQYSVNDNISDIDEVINAFEDGDIDTLAEIAECGWLCPAVCPIWDDPVNIYYSIKSGDKELSKGTLTVDSDKETTPNDNLSANETTPIAQATPPLYIKIDRGQFIKQHDMKYVYDGC